MGRLFCDAERNPQDYVNHRHSLGRLQWTSVCGRHYIASNSTCLESQVHFVQSFRWYRGVDERDDTRCEQALYVFQHYCPHKFEISPRFPPSETIQWPANMLSTSVPNCGPCPHGHLQRTTPLSGPIPPQNATSAVGRDQKGGGRVISEHCWAPINRFYWRRALFAWNLPTQIWVVKVCNAQNTRDVGAVPSRKTVWTSMIHSRLKNQYSCGYSSFESSIDSRRLVVLACNKLSTVTSTILETTFRWEQGLRVGTSALILLNYNAGTSMEEFGGVSYFRFDVHVYYDSF